MRPHRNDIASSYVVHPTELTQWKKQLLDELPQIFSDKRVMANKEHKDLEAQLYQQIG